MKQIEDYIITVAEGLERAQDFAEKAVYYHYHGHDWKSRTYRILSTSELDNAKLLSALAIQDINDMKEHGFVTPQVWKENYSDYLDKAERIRELLSVKQF